VLVMMVMVVAFLIGFGRLLGVVIGHDDLAVVAHIFGAGRVAADPRTVIGRLLQRVVTVQRRLLLLRVVQVVPGLAVGFAQSAGSFAGRVERGRRLGFTGSGAGSSAPHRASVVAVAWWGNKKRLVVVVEQGG